MPCLICERENVPTFYNFNSTTLHSLIPLKTFTERIMGIPLKIIDNDELICEFCYISLNDIDYMEKKIQKISEELKKHYEDKHRLEETDIERSVSKINDDEKDEESRPESPLETKLKRIHFRDNSDLKHILNNHLEESDSENVYEAKIDILYDMMDEKNFEIVIGKNVDEHKKEFNCNKCSQTFPTNQELKTHSSKHIEKKPYICEVCGKVYRHKTALDIHVGMHRGINPFNCRHCNKTFTQKGALRRHIKIHTGEKPFQCEECGKCFTHHTSFNIHKKSHSGEKSYKCEICSLALISTSHLKRHMRVHTGEKKYACSTCGKRFAERYNLVSHQKLHSTSVRTHTQKKKFKCELCNASFPKVVELEEHMKNHTSDNANFMVFD